MANKGYTAGDISVLDGLRPVRARPGMYIGSVDTRGLHHILWEIVDNSIDEAANKFATTICVTLNADGSATVEDNGRGIPVDIHPTEKVPGVQLVFTKLHAGGKFENENYKFSGGLHGVGASVTNALSEWLDVEVYRDKKIHHMRFYSPVDKDEKAVGIVETPLEVLGKTDKRGTKITFMPDKRVFDEVEFDYSTIENKLRELSFLIKGVKIVFTDARGEEPETQEFYSNGGLADFVEYLNDGQEDAKSNKVLTIEGESNNVVVEVAVQHTNTYTEHMYSFVNNIRTPEGGTHEAGFRTGFTRFFNDFARNNKYLGPKDANLTGDDFREGMTVVLSIKMANPLFEGQTKEKLGNQEVRQIVDSVVSEQLEIFFKNTRNKSIADFILKKALEAAKAREAARKAKMEQRSKNSITGATLVGKFAACTSKDPLECELFIVEGDSAGGSAKQGRDRRTQAVLPLRGKPLNVMKNQRERIYKNEEISTIIAALGTDIEADFNIENLRFHKIIILSDADYDGYHIRTLLLAMFFRLMPELIVQGKVYVGMPPLYKVEKKGVIKYAYDDDELDVLTEEMKAGAGDVQRYKGLGEMSKEQLWDTTLNPKTRMLTRVQMDDAAQASEMLDIFMTEGAERRKEYIFRHAKFNKVDSFLEKFGG